MLVAIIGVAGTLAGVVLGGLLNHLLSWRNEERRWSREELLRWDKERRTCYVRFASLGRQVLAGYRTYARLRVDWSEDVAPPVVELGQSKTEELLAKADELQDAYQEVRLLGSPPVAAVAASLIRTVEAGSDITSVGNREELETLWGPLNELFQSAEQSFLSAIRQELRIAPPQD